MLLIDEASSNYQRKLQITKVRQWSLDHLAQFMHSHIINPGSQLPKINWFGLHYHQPAIHIDFYYLAHTVWSLSLPF